MRIVTAILLASLSVAAFAITLTPADATERPSPRINVTGKYNSNWDDISLVQDGDRVTGTYVCCGRGTIEGRIIEGRTLRYVWRQPSAWGLGIWHVGNTQLEGTWGHQQNESNGGRWDLVRVRNASKIAN